MLKLREYKALRTLMGRGFAICYTLNRLRGRTPYQSLKALMS
jgi:hypothetical protein